MFMETDVASNREESTMIMERSVAVVGGCSWNNPILFWTNDDGTKAPPHEINDRTITVERHMVNRERYSLG